MCCIAVCAACKCCKCWLEIFAKLVKCVGKIAAYAIVIGIIVALVVALVMIILLACGVFDGSNITTTTEAIMSTTASVAVNYRNFNRIN